MLNKIKMLNKNYKALHEILAYTKTMHDTHWCACPELYDTSGPCCYCLTDNILKIAKKNKIKQDIS